MTASSDLALPNGYNHRRRCSMMWTSTLMPHSNKCLGNGGIKKKILDEAHFWLNGYVNKQNCRIWSEANPQVYVETPLHPEKLTVWCALWAGGILLQKR
ncbi:uncharacterized protein TNCV_1774501 [Trichonephila clavipes]|nr:uncharacterized protein TNCV_1774501 [Trichonephila clavipes]